MRDVQTSDNHSIRATDKDDDSRDVEMCIESYYR